MNKILEMRKKLHGLTQQLRAAQGEGNPDATKIENLSAEIRALCNQIETEEALARLQGEVDPTTRSGEATPATADQRQEETRAAILTYMRTGDSAQLRAMTSGTSGGGDTGGYLIPKEWEDRILEREKELFVMRNLADVQQSSLDRDIPIADDYGESQWIDEGGVYPESDATFKNKIISAYKLGRIAKVSEELLQDNTFNLEQWLIGALSYSNGITMEKAFISGDGAKKPRGFLIDADSVETGGNVVTYNDVLGLFSELKTGYFNNAHWMMNTKTLVSLMLLTDGSGQYLYKPFNAPAANAPMGTILGKPVVLSSFMPDIEEGQKPIALGDFKRYRIHDRLGMTVQRLDELFAKEGFIGFRGKQRTDGKLLIGEAIQALEIAA